MLSLFAKHAGIAITNARLHVESEDRARHLAVANERERVVRDVHDTVARALGSILVHLDAGDDRAVEPAHLDAARNAARSALAETRRTVLGLVPSLLEQHSLDDAIGLELAWVRSVNDLHTDLVVTGEAPEIAPDVSQQALQMVQETLTNVVLHAQAQQVRVGVFYGSDDVVIVIEDDGSGLRRRAAPRAAPRRARASTASWRAPTSSVPISRSSPTAAGARSCAPACPYDGNLVGHQPRAEALWRVLVVNHRPVVRAGLVRLLASTEPQIQVVGEIGDARDVVDAVRVLEPDVVLLELQMPGLDGARLTSYIRASSPGAVGAADRRRAVRRAAARRDPQRRKGFRRI